MDIHSDEFTFRATKDYLQLHIPNLEACRRRRQSIGHTTTDRERRGMLKKQSRVFDALI
jgi:hypothetical protein